MKTARSLPQPTRGLRSLIRPSSNRLSRLQCLRSQVHPRPHAQQQCRTFLGGGPRNPSYRAEESLNVERLHEKARGYYMRRQYFLLVGAAVSLSVFCYTAYLLEGEVRKPKRCDAGGLPPGKVDPFTDEAGTKRKTVIHDADGRELVPTGDSTVPTFPRVLSLDSPTSTSSPRTTNPDQGQARDSGVEYTLVGLGTRTVSLFGIRVYVVGFYVATQDIAAIQARLVREINPIASTLISSEKEELRRALLDPVAGEQLWGEILATVRPRSLFRIVPVRDTNFHHLRDGFVRAIQARTSSSKPSSSSSSSSSDGKVDEFGDEAFGAAMRDFKAVFNRGNVPKNGELLLSRDGAGELVVAYDDGKKKKEGEGGSDSGTIGRVADERISRLLWLNYLAGSKVASEPARNNIVEGIMEFVERPIGTVATQVL